MSLAGPRTGHIGGAGRVRLEGDRVKGGGRVRAPTTPGICEHFPDQTVRPGPMSWGGKEDGLFGQDILLQEV